MLFDNRRHATYHGDQTENIGAIVGPNLLGEYQTIDEVDHDPATWTSRVTFRPTQQGDLPTDRQTSDALGVFRNVLL